MATGIFTCFYGASCRDPLLLHSLLRQDCKLEDARSIILVATHISYANAEHFLVARIHGDLAAPIAHDLRTGDMRFLGIHHSAVGHDDRWSLAPFEFGPVLRLSDWNRFLVRSEKFCAWRRENVGLTSN